MSNRRYPALAYTNWDISIDDYSGRTSYEAAQLVVLMDIRDQLKLMNQLLNCENTLAIPSMLRAIQRNTAKPRKKRK